MSIATLEHMICEACGILPRVTPEEYARWEQDRRARAEKRGEEAADQEATR